MTRSSTGSALGLAEFFYEGQAGGHVDIRAAGVQVRQHHLKEIQVGWVHQLQILVMPGEVDQVVQIRRHPGRYFPGGAIRCQRGSRRIGQRGGQIE